MKDVGRKAALHKLTVSHIAVGSPRHRRVNFAAMSKLLDHLGQIGVGQVFVAEVKVEARAHQNPQPAIGPIARLKTQWDNVFTQPEYIF